MTGLLNKFIAFFLISAGIAAFFSFGSSGSNFAAAALIIEESTAQIEENARQHVRIWREDEIRLAVRLFKKAAAEWEKAGKLPDSARCLREAGKLKLMLAEEMSALNLLEKSLALEQKSKNLAGETETFSLLTIAAGKSGEAGKSKIYHDQALKLAAQIAEPTAQARAFFASGVFFYNEREFTRMLEQQEKALNFFQIAGDKQGETETLIELAYSRIINNDRLGGRESAEKALEIADRTGDLRNRVFALIVLGDAFQRIGEWQTAVGYFLEAEKHFPDNLDLFEKAVLYNRLGFYNLAFDELNQAKNYFQKSFALFDRLGNAEGRSELLTELGQIYVRQGNLPEAMSYFDKSRTFAAADPIALGVLDLKIGETFYNQNDFSLAEKHFRLALEQYRKIGISYRTAEVLEKLGLIYARQKDFLRARESFLAALKLNRKVFSKFAEAQNLFNLAALDDLENRPADALENIKESIKLTEAAHGETANSRLRRSYLANVHDRYELFIKLLMKMHRQFPNENYALAALQTAEKSRARVMLETLALAEADFMKDADAETVRREKEIRFLLNAKADKLTEILSRNGSRAEVEQLDGEINQLENDLEEIKARLKQNSPLYSAIKNPAPFDVEEFRKNVLDDDSLLAEFAFGDEESYLWLIGKTGFYAFVLPPREQIEAKIQTLRELLAARQINADEEIEVYQTRIAQAENEFQQTAKLLSREIFGQAAEKFGAKRLIIVPDGKLNYFPVSALPLPDSANDEPILLSNEVIYEPSASTLSLLAERKNPAAADKILLIFSDPVFTKDDSRFAANDAAENSEAGKTLTENFRFAESLNSLARLTASKAEADSIIKILGTSKTKNFSGYAANRRQLLEANAADYKILHFATHGLINEERPELSGIVLSRFDENGRKLNEFVRLQDIYGLDLNSDLVVLSACETGIGKEVRGEGLMSLNNAFLQVGAKTVMSSLWKVEDTATLELMKNFYESLAGGNVTPSKALQTAQIKLRQNKQFQSPFYWAAFTIQGDFRRAPNISADFPFSTFFAILIPALFLAAAFWYFRRRGKA